MYKLILLTLIALCLTSEIKIIFEFIDRNKDGVISVEELALYLDDFKIDDFKDSLAGAKSLIHPLESIPWREFYNRYKHLDAPKIAAKPEQIHLALTSDPSEMTVMWATKEPTKLSIVQYGINDLSLTARGINFTYQTPVPFHTDKWFHRVKLTRLEPQKKYKYRVGDGNGAWSQELSFETKGNTMPSRVALYGDMGTLFPVGYLVAGFISEEFKKNPFDMVSHAGDLAYADLGTNGRGEFQYIWDVLQRQVEPYASRVPYMVVPGNHEQYKNYTAYSARFKMPENGKGNMIYSFDFGGVHYLTMNSEIQYDDFAPGSSQYLWIETDLIRANNNRQKTPWIIFQAHRPIYYDNQNSTLMQKHLEALLHRYKVDIAHVGHNHCYFRTFPVFNNVPLQTSGNIYKNPKAPVHLMVGAAGAYAGLSKAPCNLRHKPSYIAYKEAHYGFGILNVFNATHLHFEFKGMTSRKVEDEMWIIRE